MKRRILIQWIAAVAVMLPLCGHAAQSEDKAAKKGDEKTTKQAEIRKMADGALQQLYKSDPKAKAKIEGAAGYGVFSNFGMTILFVGGAGGKGVVVDNATKKDVFMNMGQAQVGMGLGGQKYKAILVFKDAKTLKSFVDSGWDAGGQGGVAAKTSKSGAADSTGTSLHPGIEVIQITEAGAIAASTLAGTKYWKDGDLN
jgi:lipid-binding SYLF domain-containing protein